MRNISPAALCASVLLLLSHSTFAASEVNSDAGHQLIGQVSISGASTISDAVHALSAKADNAGAPWFRPIAVGGENKLFATAELLK